MSHVLFAYTSLCGTGFSIPNGHPGLLLNNGQLLIVIAGLVVWGSRLEGHHQNLWHPTSSQ